LWASVAGISPALSLSGYSIILSLLSEVFLSLEILRVGFAITAIVRLHPLLSIP